MTAGGGGPGAPRSHSSIVLIEAACTSCMICARECPSWCITIDSHTEPVQGLPAGARIRTQNVLDRFAIDWSLCMFCGICVEECPFDALEWAGDLVAPGETLAALTSQKDDLAPA
ncbi:MAG: 4Fe-4S binding protein [Propionibacteriaceae bacterium]|nr:4Fe-4S binding protein [Propionibacteriaceae bacterium]